jgi:hypothetical protein
MTAGALAARFDMSAPSVSHHFGVLKRADLVGSRRDGQQIYYFLNTTVMQDVLAMIWDLFGDRPTGGGSGVEGRLQIDPTKDEQQSGGTT